LSLTMLSLRRALQQFVQDVKFALEGPSMTPALAGFTDIERNEGLRSSDDELVNKGLLWAVPTKRRSLDRRLWRRVGHPFFQAKVRRDLRACTECGNYHEVHTICGACYDKIKVEAKEIQDRMAEFWEWNPVDKETIVRYQGEPITEEDRKTKQIVELPRERPKFFSANLTQKTNNTTDQ